ncbi:MAG: hypothetical protein ACI8RD_012781 [Bacillariaceae sp.]|jgi:hypothetical protein
MFISILCVSQTGTPIFSWDKIEVSKRPIITKNLYITEINEVVLPYNEINSVGRFLPTKLVN